MTLSQDILAELAEIAPDSALAAARAVREAATRHAQGSYETLFGLFSLFIILPIPQSECQGQRKNRR